jgi:hypothetical protein
MKRPTKRLLFAVYAACGLCVLVAAVAAPREGDTFKAVVFRFVQLRMLIAALLGSMAVFVSILVEARLRWVNVRALRSGIHTTLTFGSVTVVLTMVCGFNLYFLFDGLLSGAFYGVIGGLFRYREDFSFLLDSSLPPDAKRSRLDKSYDMLVRGLTLFTTIFFGGLVGGALLIAGARFNAGDLVAVISIAIVVSYLAVGVIPGVYIRVFRAMQDIKERYSQIGAEVKKPIIVVP